MLRDHMEDQTTIRTQFGAIFVSLELSRKTWLITSLSPGKGEKMSKRGAENNGLSLKYLLKNIAVRPYNIIRPPHVENDEVLPPPPNSPHIRAHARPEETRPPDPRQGVAARAAAAWRPSRRAAQSCAGRAETRRLRGNAAAKVRGARARKPSARSLRRHRHHRLPQDAARARRSQHPQPAALDAAPAGAAGEVRGRPALPHRGRLRRPGRPADGDRRAGRGRRGERARPGAARRHRLGQDLHHGQGDRGDPAPGPDPGAQQDPGRPALRRVQVASSPTTRSSTSSPTTTTTSRRPTSRAPTPISRRNPRSTSRSTACATRPPGRSWSATTSSSSPRCRASTASARSRPIPP